MFNQLDLGIILNPTAGRGHARRCIQQLKDCLHEKRIAFKLEITSCPGHAKDIAVRMKEEFETIVAAGGDGTVNEVTTGIVGSKTALAILPIGSGNDFNKVIGIPKNIYKAIDVILNGHKELLDLGQLQYYNSKGEKKKCYFVNTLGIGLDAEIANETKNIKYIRGLPLYLLAAMKALSVHSPNEYRITENGSITRNVRAFFICVGNGSYEGGGFKILPEAIQNDSHLDICLIGAIKIFKAIKIIPSLINGTHKDKENISMWKSRQVSIEAKKPFVLHCDGEVLELHTIKAIVGLASKRINVIVPKKHAIVL